MTAIVSAIFFDKIYTTEIQNLLNRKLREIFKTQFPTERYSLRAFYMKIYLKTRICSENAGQK